MSKSARKTGPVSKDYIPGEIVVKAISDKQEKAIGKREMSSKQVLGADKVADKVGKISSNETEEKKVKPYDAKARRKGMTQTHFNSTDKTPVEIKKRLSEELDKCTCPRCKVSWYKRVFKRLVKSLKNLSSWLQKK